MIKLYKWILIVVVAGAIFCILFFTLHKPNVRIDVREGQIKDIKTMAQLCAIDLYNEVPILDTINNRVMFAVQKQRGSISFDLENMEIKSDKDTVYITLSPEIIELNESTEPNSWQVIDTKALGKLSMFRSDAIPEEDENILKGKIKGRSIKQLYSTGVIEKARLEGGTTLQVLMEKIYSKPVKIIDPTPKGAHYKEYYDPNI